VYSNALILNHLILDILMNSFELLLIHIVAVCIIFCACYCACMLSKGVRFSSVEYMVLLYTENVNMCVFVCI